MNAPQTLSPPAAGEVDMEHHELTLVADALSRICRTPPIQGAACGNCQDETIKDCRQALLEASQRVQSLFLDHFHREEAVMDDLPVVPAISAHCGRHREAHVQFSTHYNQAIGDFDPARIFLGKAGIENLVIDWVHQHVMEYDQELARLTTEHAADLPYRECLP